MGEERQNSRTEEFPVIYADTLPSRRSLAPHSLNVGCT